jgi:trans-aconitate methyltransferase
VDSALYESRHSFVWNYGADLVPLLDPQPGERILDLGCGTGQLTARIAESGARVVGLDSSPEMIGQARQNYPNLEFKLADAASFSFPREFDAVFSNAALHWVREAENVIRCVASCLRPGGRFVAEFGGRRNVGRFLQAAKRVLEGRGYLYENRWYFPAVGEYATLLERNEFEVAGAWHFDRWTKLDEGSDAMRDWIQMFGSGVLGSVPKSEWRAVVSEIEDHLRPELFVDGRWYMDYVRLRVQAMFRPVLPHSARR